MENLSGMLLLAFGPFGSAMLLLWGLAAAAPVLIHLWSRRRYREMEWAAMEQLLAALRKNSRRIRVEQLLLLIVRVLILLLLALALAEPFLPFFSSLGVAGADGGHTHWVMVIDGSFSMDYRRSDGSHFSKAKELAAKMVSEQAQQGDGFTLVLLSDPPQVVIGEPAFDPADVVEEINALQMRHAGGNLTATLSQVQDILTRAATRSPRLVSNRVCLFSDLGRNTWDEVLAANCRTRIASLAENSQLLLFDLGDDNQQNLAVTSLAMDEPLATAGRSIRFTAQVHNFGDVDASGKRVKVLLDGLPVYEESLSIAAGSSTAIETGITFDTTGEHQIEARLEGDSLEIDNHRYMSVAVRESIRVLCIGGKPGSARLVQRALNPFTTGEPYIRAELAPESALVERNLAAYDCVYLCNVARFSAEEAGVLREFLSNGGGVVICLGDQVEPANYNEMLATPGRRVLPARLGPLVRTGEHFLSGGDYKHPVARPFRDNEQAGLFTLPTFRYYKLEPIEKSQAVTALTFNGSDPALVEEKILRGRCILFATAASEKSVDSSTSPPVRWTLAPDWLNYPALHQEILRAAVAGRDQTRNTLVGEELTGGLPGTGSGAALNIVQPDNVRQNVRMTVDGEENRWQYSAAWKSGLYRAEYGRPVVSTQFYAVNVNTAESDLTRFDTTRLPAQIQRDGAGGSEEDPALPASRPPPLFRYFLFAVLALLFVEVFLGRWFGRGS